MGVHPGLAEFDIELGASGFLAGNLRGQSRQAFGEIASLRHLRDSQVERVVAGLGKGLRIGCRHLAAILVGIELVPLGDLRQGIRGRAALDQMIGHHGMDHVLRAAARHVAAHAIRRCGVVGGGDGSVTLRADAVVVQGGLLAARHVVRIVAGGAGEFAGAAQEALRLAQAVSRVGDFKILLIFAAGRVIEEEHEIAQRLAWIVGERAAAVTLDGMRQGEAGGLQVALQADLHLTIAAQPRGIDDGGAHLVGGRSGGMRSAHMVAARTVAALAIDAFGESAGIERLTARFVVAGGNPRVGVVAEHALVSDGSRRQGIVAIAPGAHRPGAAVFRIPGEGKLDQGAAIGAVQVAADVVAGAHDVIDARFLRV